MSIKKALLGRVGIVLSVAVAAMVAVALVGCNGEDNPGGGGNYTVGNITINGLTWTDKNINIKTADSWCYGNKSANCSKYGRLYTLAAAKSACESMGDEWRLPTYADWENLIDYAGGEDVAGKKLKSKSGWGRCFRSVYLDYDYCVDNGNGTDDYGFSALPGGTYSGGVNGFSDDGAVGYWWGGEGGRTMSWADGTVTGFSSRGNANSVRCVTGGTPKVKVKYTVTFDAFGGAPADISPITVDSGKAVGTLPAVAMDGFRFVGWFDGVTCYHASTIVTKDVVLTAKWGESVDAINGTDPRDGKVYPIVEIGGQVWLAKNLNFAADSSWCYDDDLYNCAMYGRLYAWNAAKSACAGLGGKWGLPTNEDWENLVSYASGDDFAPARKLKSKSGWIDGTYLLNGTDDYGFSALPGGCRDPDDSFVFTLAGANGYWWTATEYDGRGGGADGYEVYWDKLAYYRGMSPLHNNVLDPVRLKNYGMSVRCVIQD